MKLIVGLGNPGKEYTQTKHNAGFWILDLLAKQHSAIFSNKRNLQCQLAKTHIAGVEVLLTKPLTFMNDSGRAIQSILNWHKDISTAELLVVHDDIALPLGKLRLQHGGGAGGHHGIESIVKELGGRNSFDRLKFGVGPDPGGDVRANFVLAKIPEEEMKLCTEYVEIAGKAIICWSAQGVQEAMNKFNGGMNTD